MPKPSFCCIIMPIYIIMFNKYEKIISIASKSLLIEFTKFRFIDFLDFVAWLQAHNSPFPKLPIRALG